MEANVAAPSVDSVEDVDKFLRAKNPRALKDMEIVCSSSRRNTMTRMKHAIFKLHGQSGSECMTWPESTSLPCWNCFHNFDTPPLAVPVSKDPQTGIYFLDAVICSAPCGLRYIFETAGSSAPNQTLLFREMLREVFHVTGKHVMAPERRWLKAFCGDDTPGAMSIQEYRDTGATGKRLRTLKPPFVPATVVLEHVADEPAEQPSSATILASGGHVVRGLRRPQVGDMALGGAKPADTMTASMAGGCVDPSKPALYTTFLQQKIGGAGGNSTTPAASGAAAAGGAAAVVVQPLVAGAAATTPAVKRRGKSAAEVSAAAATAAPSAFSSLRKFVQQ